MYENIIKEYISKLTEKDIKKYCIKKDIIVDDDEVKILYLYAKNYWKEFYKGNPIEYINELKESINTDAFNKLEKIYNEISKKIR